MTWVRWASSWSSQAVSCGSVVMRGRVREGPDNRTGTGPELWTAAGPVDDAARLGAAPAWRRAVPPSLLPPWPATPPSADGVVLRELSPDDLPMALDLAT